MSSLSKKSMEPEVFFESAIKPVVANWSVYRLDELLTMLTLLREENASNTANRRAAVREQEAATAAASNEYALTQAKIGVGLANGLFRENPLLPKSPQAQQRKAMINSALGSARRISKVPKHSYHYAHAKHVATEFSLSAKSLRDGEPYQDPIENFDPDKLYHSRSKAIREMLDSNTFAGHMSVRSDIGLQALVSNKKTLRGVQTGAGTDGNEEGVVPTFAQSIQPIYSPIASESVVAFY